MILPELDVKNSPGKIPNIGFSILAFKQGIS